MALTETDAFGRLPEGAGNRTNGDQSEEDTTDVSTPPIPPPPPSSAPGPRISAVPPPVSARPSEGSRPDRRDDFPTDGSLPPPVMEPPPPVRRRTLSERWQANRDWLVPTLWIGFVLVLGALVFLAGMRLKSAVLLFAATVLVVTLRSVIKRSRRNTAKAKMCHLRFNERKRIVGSFNTNGGSGKTTIIALVATLWAELSRKENCLVDLNNNSGHAGERLGIRERFTVRVSHIYNQLRCDPAALRSLAHELPTTNHRLVVIDREEEVIEKDRLRREQVRDVLHALDKVFHSLFLDNGNDVIGEYEMAAADEVDVALLVANTGKPESLIDVAKTINNFERNGIDNLRNRTIVVLCRPYPWPFKRWNTLPDLDPSVPVFHLPWDLHIKRVKLGRPLEFDKLRGRTREALYDIALAICDLAPPVKTRLSPDQDAETWIDEILAEERMLPSTSTDVSVTTQPSTDPS